jgi:hypothetical protein
MLQGILVKAARVPHDCGKEQEGELAVEAPMADDDVGLCVGQWAAERTLMSPRGGGVNRRDDQFKLFSPKHLS